MNDSRLGDTTPQRFTRRQRFILRVAPPLAVAVIKLILLTCRKEIRSDILMTEAIAQGPVVGGFWHETIAVILFAMRGTGFYTLTSHSFDGELAARMVESFGAKAIRGSSSRGGLNAIEEMTAAMKVAPALGFTLDGPRGPRREAKPGLAMLSARIQAPIYPVTAVISRCWRLNSWDRFIIPCPFARVIYAGGKPIDPPASLDKAVIRAKTREIQDVLNTLTAELEAELGQEPYWPPAKD